MDLISPARRVSFFMLISGISIFWDWSSAKFVAACKSGLSGSLEPAAHMGLQCFFFTRHQSARLFLALPRLQVVVQDEDGKYHPWRCQ